MYDLRSDQEVITYQDSTLNAGVTSLALSNSGRLIFAGYDDFNCHIWDSLKGEKIGGFWFLFVVFPTGSRIKTSPALK